MDMGPSLSAIRSYAVRQAVSAHNVANINTNDFKSSRVTLEELPDSQGVGVQSIQQREQAIQSSQAEQEQNISGDRVESQNARTEYSDTDLSTEMVNMMQNELAYSANAAVIQTIDRMQGELLDKLV